MAGNGHGARGGSWFAAFMIIAGFAAGGVGFMLGPAWWLVWVGVGVVVFGGVTALAVGIMDDAGMDEPRVVPEEVPAGATVHGRPVLRGGGHGDPRGNPTATDPQTQQPHG